MWIYVLNKNIFGQSYETDTWKIITSRVHILSNLNQSINAAKYTDCYLCVYIFQTSRYLTEHIAAVHEGTLESWMEQNIDVNIMIVIIATIFSKIVDI